MARVQFPGGQAANIINKAGATVECFVPRRPSWASRMFAAGRFLSLTPWGEVLVSAFSWPFPFATAWRHVTWFVNPLVFALVNRFFGPGTPTAEFRHHVVSRS